MQAVHGGQGSVRAGLLGGRRSGLPPADRVITSARGRACSRATCSFRRNDPQKRADHEPQFTVIDMPGFSANPATDKTNSETFILLNFAKRLVIIGGTNYAGEIKKSIFTS
jgi:phosphoenolpyruvate carboxykinase (ATP)